jgi:hypothetical protein
MTKFTTNYRRDERTGKWVIDGDYFETPIHDMLSLTEEFEAYCFEQEKEYNQHREFVTGSIVHPTFPFQVRLVVGFEHSKPKVSDTLLFDPMPTPWFLKVSESTTKEPEDLYSGYDAMVLPRRYAGLCLPMNEALLSGLPVFMPRISPNNVILPDKWTVEASKIDEFKAKAIIDVYDIDPKALAKTLDDYMGKKYSLIKQEAFDIGFINFATDSLKNKYLNLINS